MNSNPLSKVIGGQPQLWLSRIKDGGIRICADFKVTINAQLCPKTFPLPTADEVFSTLAGGESFTKLDIAHAFKQMEVEEES